MIKPRTSFRLPAAFPKQEVPRSLLDARHTKMEIHRGPDCGFLCHWWTGTQSRAQCFRSVERRWGARIRELLEENGQKVTLRRKAPSILEVWRHSMGRAFWSQKAWFYVRTKRACRFLELHPKRLMHLSSPQEGWIKALCFQHRTLHRVGTWCPEERGES